MRKVFNNIQFDDYTKGEDGEWSQVCKCCVDKHKIDEKYLDDAGSGICGIEGCENESDFYIDFY